MTIPPEKSDAIFPSESIKPGPAAGQPKGAAFQSYMQDTGTSAKSSQAPMGAASAGAAPQSTQAGAPSLNTLTAQVSTSQDSLVNTRNQLNKIKDTQLTRSQAHLIRNKLSDATTYLRAANAKMGADVPAAPPQSGQGPIERFLSYIVDGENQLGAARQKLKSIAKDGGSLRPADMMLVQIKLNQAEQEISYASAILSKVVSSVNQLLSTQL